MGTGLLQNYRDINPQVEASVPKRRDRQDLKWRKLEGTKINTNVSLFEVQGQQQIGMGFIVRDKDGGLLLAGAKRIQFGLGPKEAELQALVWGLSKCLEEPIACTEVEMDCKNVVQSLLCGTDMGPAGLLIQDCKLFLEELLCNKILFCRRECNSTAHHLAREARQMEEEESLWRILSDLPVLIAAEFMKDLHGGNDNGTFGNDGVEHDYSTPSI